MTSNTQIWWASLIAVAGFNIGFWIWTARLLQRRRHEMTADLFVTRRLQLLLSAVYVLGCAYRSVLLVYDVPRIVMVDSWLSSVLVGRSVATVAELCLVGQLALLLNEFARATASNFARRVSHLAVPLIVMAEVFSWYSVLTTSNIGHTVEESLWAFMATLMVAGVVSIRARTNGYLRRVLDVCCLAGIAYVAYMVLVDVPMYWSRWLADEAAGRSYLSVSQGLADAATQWTVSRSWAHWRTEVAWMSLYFSVAVWFSVGLIHTPVISAAASVQRVPRLLPNLPRAVQ